MPSRDSLKRIAGKWQAERIHSFSLSSSCFFSQQGDKKAKQERSAPPADTCLLDLKKKKKEHEISSFSFGTLIPTPSLGGSRSLAVRLKLCVGPLDGCKALCLLCVLDHGSVAEVILVPRLDAEGALSAHASHRLLHVHCTDVLKARETNVQRAERT